MAKKLSQAEHVAAMLDEGKVREYVTKHTLYPAVLVGGTKKDGEERVRYRELPFCIAYLHFDSSLPYLIVRRKI